MFYYDETMLVLMPGLLLGIYAQWKVSAAFKEGKNKISKRGMSGKDVARELLDTNGLHSVSIEPINSGDHYDPQSKTVRLELQNYHGSDLTSIAVAAHEVGHAIQHKLSYTPLTLRSAFTPVVNLSNQMSMPLFFLGMILSLPFLVNLGILLFALTVAFYLITLPVEYNASQRAMAMLSDHGYVYSEELPTVKKVLDAAALTYVSATITAILSFARLLLLRKRRN